MNKLLFTVFLLSPLAAFLPASVARAEIMVKNGETVAFLGDSITAQGWSSTHGYVKLVVAGLESSGVKIVPIPAGVGGNKSNDMLARLKRDVLDKKPDWVTVSCGMNDVIHGAKGIPLDQYKANMTAIVEQCQKAAVKVMILTTTTAGKWDSDSSKKLGEYSGFLRELAKEKQCVMADLYPVFIETAKAGTPLRGLTYDGVHLMPEGNILLARTVLMAFGCSDAQLEKAYQAWLDIPNAGSFSTRVDVVLNKKYFNTTSVLTLREREKLLVAAKAAGKPTLMHWSKDLFMAMMKKKVQPAGPYASLEALFDPGVKDKVQGELQSEFAAEIKRIVNEPN